MHLPLSAHFDRITDISCQGSVDKYMCLLRILPLGIFFFDNARVHAIQPPVIPIDNGIVLTNLAQSHTFDSKNQGPVYVSWD